MRKVLFAILLSGAFLAFPPPGTHALGGGVLLQAPEAAAPDLSQPGTDLGAYFQDGKLDVFGGIRKAYPGAPSNLLTIDEAVDMIVSAPDLRTAVIQAGLDSDPTLAATVNALVESGVYDELRSDPERVRSTLLAGRPSGIQSDDDCAKALLHLIILILLTFFLAIYLQSCSGFLTGGDEIAYQHCLNQYRFQATYAALVEIGLFIYHFSRCAAGTDGGTKPFIDQSIAAARFVLEFEDAVERQTFRTVWCLVPFQCGYVICMFGTCVSPPPPPDD